MIKKMSGLRREYEYPVLCIGEEIAISDEEKAEMFRKEFSKINSSDNLMRECKEKREKLLKEHPFILEKKRVTNSCLDAPFSYSELKRALKNTKASTPGQDGISYVMLKKLSDESLKIILQFYNRVWEEGILPKRWKEAVIIPIKKPALQVEMGEMPIHLRRKQLILTYWINLKGQKDNHPTKGIMETCWEYGKGKVNSFGWIIKDLVQSMKLDEYRVIPAVILPITPLWILPQPYVDLFLLESRKDKEQRMSEAEMAKEYIGIKYEQYIKVFTDASKDPQKGQVGVAYIIPRLKVARGERVSDHVSVFTGELLAIMVAINKISEMGINKTLICSDSSSALMCLEAQKSDTRQDIVLEILQILFMMQQKNKIVQFLWVPAHTGVAGNEAADKLAKHSMAKENIDIQIGCNQGRQFESEVVLTLCNLLNIKKTRTTPYHPASDGMVERFNRTLIDQIAKILLSCGGEWDDYIKQVAFAYNSSNHSSTKFSPYFLVHGREPRMPTDCLLATRILDCDVSKSHADFVSTLLAKLQNAFRSTRMYSEVAFDRYKLYHDSDLRHQPYTVGAMVWLNNPVESRMKLAPHWIGPL
ncbi:uncharacterized protein LOC120484610 [Pimephales promelas]|uniref:uncharacterized protein LOC120484610 n=1 Tax=Pimephales promelas TaxID=90988 RepID=UPI0019558A47|nr:uncharacterized protein LOC120484610 [Pimephales promelas]